MSATIMMSEREARDRAVCESHPELTAVVAGTCERAGCRRPARWQMRSGVELCPRDAARRLRHTEWREKVRAGREMAAGLRQLAAFIAANPDLVHLFRYSFDDIRVPLISSEDPKVAMAAVVRAGLRSGATVKKLPDSDFAGATITWGKVGIEVYADRELVCERVVTGTETVTREVPDPAALAAVPTVEVTEEVERVEWVCRPLLAAGADQ